MSSTFFFDIETIPGDEATKEIFRQVQERRFKKRNAMHEFTEEKLNDLWLGTSFDGTFGRICCISYIHECADGSIEKKSLTGDEKTLLQTFWSTVVEADLFVGHNVLDFDLPFIHKRSIIHQVKPSVDFATLTHKNPHIYDTMWEWQKWSRNSNIGLDTLARIFGFPTPKDLMDGSEVWTYFQKGKIQEIAEYCMKDVEVTRKVYYRMMFKELSHE